LIDDPTRESIDEMNSRNKGFVPKREGHGCMCEKRKPYFDNMSMFTLGRTILLVSVWARHVMSDANTLKEGIQALILPTPISLHGNDFPIQQAFNKFLKVNEVLKNFRFVSKKVNPSKFAKIINKAHIVIVSSNRSWSRTPYIRENKVQGII
jgi:hypothetical protein